MSSASSTKSWLLVDVTVFKDGANALPWSRQIVNLGAKREENGGSVGKEVIIASTQ